MTDRHLLVKLNRSKDVVSVSDRYVARMSAWTIICGYFYCLVEVVLLTYFFFFFFLIFLVGAQGSIHDSNESRDSATYALHSGGRKTGEGD